MSVITNELMTIAGFNTGEEISISVGAKLSPLPGQPGGTTNTHWVGEAGGSGVKGHATASVRHTTTIAGVSYTFIVVAERIDGSWRVDHHFRRESGSGGRLRPVTRNAGEGAHEKVQDIIKNLRDPEVQDRINEIGGLDAKLQMILHREQLEKAVESMLVIEHQQDETGIVGKWERSRRERDARRKS